MILTQVPAPCWPRPPARWRVWVWVCVHKDTLGCIACVPLPCPRPFRGTPAAPPLPTRPLERAPAGPAQHLRIFGGVPAGPAGDVSRVAGLYLVGAFGGLQEMCVRATSQVPPPTLPPRMRISQNVVCNSLRADAS